jgi:hypothetical protein
MARGTAHAPKPDDQRRRRNAPTTGERVFARTGETHGPTLDAATFRADWPQEVRAWWETWRAQPQAVSFEGTDWQRLADLAPLREMLLARDLSPGERTKILSEVRMNEERLGATFTDRQRARIRFADSASEDYPDGPGLAPVTSIAAARDRWAAEVDDTDDD